MRGLPKFGNDGAGEIMVSAMGDVAGRAKGGFVPLDEDFKVGPAGRADIPVHVCPQLCHMHRRRSGKLMHVTNSVGGLLAR